VSIAECDPHEQSILTFQDRGGAERDLHTTCGRAPCGHREGLGEGRDRDARSRSRAIDARRQKVVDREDERRSMERLPSRSARPNAATITG
jgi:hypothetical protein